MGVKIPQSYGGISHPFDLAIHPAKAVAKILQNDFEDYLNPDFTEFNKERGYFINTKYGVRFSHDRNTSFEELSQRYSRRINNFHHDIKHNPVIFIVHNNRCFRNLATTIKEKFPEVEFKMIFVNTSRSKHNFQGSKFSISEQIEYIQVPYPYEGYIWHEPKHYASEGGIKFESQVIKWIKEAMLDFLK